LLEPADTNRRTSACTGRNVRSGGLLVLGQQSWNEVRFGPKWFAPRKPARANIKHANSQ
jgi:hypothetical protein